MTYRPSEKIKYKSATSEPFQWSKLLFPGYRPRASPSRAENRKASIIVDPAIQVIDVEKRFGDQVVLKKVSMEVQEGQVAALIGPSGAGKSTLLRCINLLERPTSGLINVEGVAIDAEREITGKELSDLRSRVG
ncbi:ATP-binding cassette domain-containing protein, partial [Bacillus mobilis]|uniref:ATP-binding cassette domain-containing protein n=1 Tax=Bacillus mobilis TaxID=2026190 RepID=UPI00363ED65D